MIKVDKIHKFSVFILFVLMFIACGGPKKKAPENIYADDILYTDEFKLEDSHGLDFSGEPYAMGVDESFDDFVFAYAVNQSFQLQRTHFPLQIVDDLNSTILVEKEQWENDTLFTDRAFYTILFDNEEDMDLVSQPDLNEARVEWIYLDSKSTKSYNFKRTNKIWMLESISKGHLKEYPNEEFVKFYSQFASDSLFQLSRLPSSIEYITTNPEDDFDILETVIDINSWQSLKPVLPTRKLVNINYGQPNEPSSKTKILAVKGIGNGFSNVFFFRLTEKGIWELFKFEDIGI